TGGADSDAIDIFDAADAVESGEEEISVPETQTPSFEKGLIIPENSILCFPHNTDPPQYNCNHHGSTVIELPDKSIAAVWYHGVAEKSPDSRIIWSKWSPATGKWSQPEMLFDDPYRSEGNPALWVNEKGDFFLFFPSIYGGTWDTAKVRMIKSADGGKSWSEPVTLYDEYCWNARHEPLRLANGDILLPLYIECLALPSFIRSSDDFKTWTVHDELTPEYFLDHTGQIQPSLILLEDGIVAAITRDGLQTNRIKRMTSSDNGYTWTPSVPLGLPNSGTSVDWVRLMDGSVVVVFNNSPDSRFPLSAALSHDGGETFSAIRDVNAECPGGGCSYAYPSVTQSSLDGSIWVTYTHNPRLRAFQ
ncbi:MAG: exo-alpha-sialidase, partial [Deltaproteobacteria bacterium]|nr:exo-alpha-sialidase [Deltaproteobacteria bacterium]